MFIELGHRQEVNIGPKNIKIGGIERKFKLGDGFVFPGYLWIGSAKSNPHTDSVALTTFNLQDQKIESEEFIRVDYVYQVSGLPDTFFTIQRIPSTRKLQLIVLPHPEVKFMPEKVYKEQVLTFKDPTKSSDPK